MKAARIVTCAATMVLASGIAAHAAETEGWSFELTPYVWYAGLEGDITVDGQKADFEKDASDLFDAAEAGISVRFKAEYNRIVLGGLIDYFSLSTDELDVEDRPAGGRLDTEMLMSEVMVGYRVDGFSEGQNFIIGVGVRNLSIENDGELAEGGTFANERDVTDAMLYVLPNLPVFPSHIDGLTFNPWLGIGAGDSDLAYELFPQFQYHATEHLALRFGYRTVGWKFKDDNNDDNELNISLSGLILGVGVTF